jgi:divalent metal cation (Fe/Co/Zn/Cd) transporter
MEGVTAARAAHNDRVVAAIRWSALSLGWALLVGVASVAAGVAAHATALVGFGLNSVVDGAASAMLVWRFEHERRGMRSADNLERRAARVVGVVLLLLAVFLAVRASVALAGRSGPKPSSLGVGLTGASMLVLPILATAKLRLARALESRALRADGVLSGAGAALAAAALIALVLNTTLDWWWADSVAAIAIAAALLREGALTVSLGARGVES